MNGYVKHMDHKTLANEIYENLWISPESTMAMDLGHTKDLHEGKTNSELLERMLTEGKSAVSSFSDHDTMMDCLTNVVGYHSSKIAAWLQSSRSEFDRPADYGRLALSQNIDGEPVGHGFRDNLKEYETPVVTIVLERDLADDAPYGFLVKTAYADIEHPDARETGLMLSKEDVLEENVLDFSSPAKEAAFCLLGEFPGIRVKAGVDHDGTEEIVLQKDEGGQRFSAFVKDYRTAVYLREGNRNLQIDRSEAPKDFRHAIACAEDSLHNVSLSYNNYPGAYRELSEKEPERTINRDIDLTR